MRYLGIDYGKKRIGLAVSDEAGHFAFAHSVIATHPQAAEEVAELCKKEQIQAIVIGKSLTLSGEPNPIMTNIERFADNLKLLTGLPTHFEPEFYTSREAEQIIGKDDLHDARAAALILTHYLEKRKN